MNGQSDAKGVCDDGTIIKIKISHEQSFGYFERWMIKKTLSENVL